MLDFALPELRRRGAPVLLVSDRPHDDATCVTSLPPRRGRQARLADPDPRRRTRATSSPLGTPPKASAASTSTNPGDLSKVTLTR